MVLDTQLALVRLEGLLRSRAKLPKANDGQLVEFAQNAAKKDDAIGALAKAYMACRNLSRAESMARVVAASRERFAAKQKMMEADREYFAAISKAVDKVSPTASESDNGFLQSQLIAADLSLKGRELGEAINEDHFQAVLEVLIPGQDDIALRKAVWLSLVADLLPKAGLKSNQQIASVVHPEFESDRDAAVAYVKVTRARLRVEMGKPTQ
jgi:hypothetical protein